MFSSLMNLRNVDPRKQPLFLGEKLGLQRYDQLKYPIFLQLYKKQREFNWSPEEISLTLDRAQFSQLEPHEQFIFTKNLSFQTMLDSAISYGVPVFESYISNPELSLCLGEWARFERLHSYSYNYIIENAYTEPTKIFDAILEDREILTRATSVLSAYEKLAEGKNIKEDIYLSLISVNILEAVRFYVSFITAFAFAEIKKMVGNADIVKLVRRDEAVHLYITQNIINILQKEKSEGFTEITKLLEDKAIEMFLEGAEEEKKWASYLFSKGSILGLNEQILHRYIEWLVDSRMKSIGLPQQFKTNKNPIGGWSEAWMDSSKVQVAPQETEITSYKIGASKADVSGADYSDMEL
jgi:ribonucleoside-diphosphate reductase beta chain